MNEYLIRNGFSESDSVKMLKMNSGVRDYVNNEHRGQVYVVNMQSNKSSKKRFNKLKFRKMKYNGSSHIQVADAVKL